MLGEKDLKKISGEVLRLAGKVAAGSEAFVAVSSSRAANTRFAESEITSTGDVDETSVTVTIGKGKRQATAVINQTDAASLRTVVDRAAEMARIAPEDPERMPVLGKQKYTKSPDAFDEATAKLDGAARANAAAAAIEAATGAGVKAYGFFDHSGSARAIASSAGLSAFHASTMASLTVTARTSDGTGSGWAQGLGERAASIDPAAIARRAIDKAARSAKPKKLDPGRYTVVLEPAAVGELIGFMAGALNARSVDEGRSYFAKFKLGDAVFGDAVTLRSDPANPAMPGAPFDGDGLPLAPHSWIDKGKLNELVYNRYWASKQGKQPTGGANRLEVAGGAASDDELIKGVKRGVLITRFWYVRWLDPQSLLVTGLTRDGTFLIEDGKVTAAVNNFRFNESPAVMFKNAEAMSKDLTRVGAGLRVPAIRTAEFNLASISEAV
jgi:predicted Zn-dependent protease